MNLNRLKKLSGDASFRYFYRSRNGIIVFCDKNKKSNIECFKPEQQLFDTSRKRILLSVRGNANEAVKCFILKSLPEGQFAT